MKASVSSLGVKVLLVSLFCVQMVLAQEVPLFGGGSGTLADPYQLSSLAHLESLSQRVNAGTGYTGKYFRLTQNIDASATSDASSLSNKNGKGFDPIGSDVLGNWFKGHLNGGGYAVKDLYINRPSERDVGFIGYVGDGSTIDSLGVVGGNIIGEISVGCLGGSSYGTITNCYATGSVTGDLSVGGFVGNSDGSITKSYATSTVSGATYVGGFVGTSDGHITQSYATGKVTSGSFVGGFVSNTPSPDLITDSYWDKETTGQENSAGTGAVGKTTLEMKMQGTYTNWDFVNTWVIASDFNGGYPYLKCQVRDTTTALEVVEFSLYEVSQMMISPNPVSRSAGEVTIYFPQNIIGTGSCSIYDAQGNRVDHQDVNLVRGTAIIWDLCNEQGRRVASGGYLCILQITDSMGMVHFQKAMIGVSQ